MSVETCVGRIGALAVALGVGIAVAVPPQVAMAEPEDPDDYNALLVCGSTCPQFDEATSELVMDQFVTPIFDQTHPGLTLTPHAVTAPGEVWPLTGFLRLLELAVGDPRFGALDGLAWPDVPLWKLSGLFDLTGDQSVRAGVVALEAAMADAGNDNLVIYGYSQGATTVVEEKRRLAAQYPEGTDAPDITFVIGGTVNTPNGGLYARFPGLYLPVIDWTFNGPAPTDTQFATVSINRQYDGFADFPLYPLNVISLANALLGAAYVHGWPFDVSLPDDPTTSPAYQGTHGDTSYYFFETEDLPLFGPLRTLGVPEQLIDVFEPFFRVVVELGYDRSIKPWEPTPARLLPTTINRAEVASDLVDAVAEGIDNAAALLDPPAPSVASTFADFEAPADEPVPNEAVSRTDADPMNSSEPTADTSAIDVVRDEDADTTESVNVPEDAEPESDAENADPEPEPSEAASSSDSEEPSESSDDESSDYDGSGSDSSDADSNDTAA